MHRPEPSRWRALPAPLRRTLGLILLFAAALLAAGGASAQTCSVPGQAGTASITSQPNTFFPGTGSPGAGATSLSVGAATGVVRAIEPGDLLLIIQMQGSDIDVSNTNGYGDGTVNAGVTNTVAFGAAGYAGGATNAIAGTYEWAVAAGTTATGGGTVNLMSPLANSYFTRAVGAAATRQSWQVVRVPQHANLTVGAALTVQPWDGSTGGVMVLEATGDINLGANTITGSGRGFRGAGAVNTAANGTCTAAFNTTGCQQYVTTIALNYGASKGEGLAGTPGRIYVNDPTGAGTGTVNNSGVDGYPGGEGARGAPGNAGGGGNQHNAGGGGGGNGGAGGQGGNTWNSSNPAFVGLVLGGFGGAQSGNSATRWIMGGGGGAGDVGGNGSTSPDGSGGAGGALVILRASRITTTGGGAFINVNGAPGQIARATDAAGGGGAGGTVVVTAGSLVGALTVNANGGAGGRYNVAGAEQDGAGGGGGGGVLVTNVGGIIFNAAGGAAGTTASTACAPANPGADCGQRAGLATAGTAGYAIVSPGVRIGPECLPNLTVTKTATTPVVTSSTGATAGYVITISNSGGAARFVTLADWTLPPGWTRAAAAPTYGYSPVQPLAAGRLSAGAETIAPATSSTWAVGATPLVVPAAGANTLTFTSFALPPVVGGVPSVVTVTITVSIPDTATVGTYHNGAGVSFLDPTRPANSTATVTPATNASANRNATPYAANTTYANFAGAAATSVAGSNHSALQAGPASDDVQLVPDFSIAKAAPATAAAGSTFTYTLTPRNNGRPVSTQTYALTQATDVPLANVGTVLGANPLTVTDTLPAGITLTAGFNGVGWSCTGTSTVVCTLAAAYPVTASTNFTAITATALMQACSGNPVARTNTAQISAGVGETVSGNNTATAITTASPCDSANLTVTKTNGVGTVTAGGTTAYTITVANLGPSSVANATVTDPVSPGLSCTALTCSVTGGGAVCPVGPLVVGTLQSPGYAIPSLPAGSSVSFVLSCNVTASGL